MTEVNIDDVGRIVSSRHNYVVLLALREEQLTPSAIRDSTQLSGPRVSNAITPLRDIGAIELLVDESRRKGRIYGITEYGEALLDYVEEEAPNLQPDEAHSCPVCGREHPEAGP